MSITPTNLVPIGVRGMKVLNRQKFLRNIIVPVLKVSDEKVAKVIPICKNYLLKLENFKPVQSFTDNNQESMNKCIYLNPEKVTKWTDFLNSDFISFEEQGITEKNFHSKEIQLTYDNFKYETIFKAVLPENEEVVSGFSQIGHIIHLNLREHLLDYRQLIGQVLVDKIKTCRTVVNKSNIIDNTYRNFSMEVIAGDEDFLVTVKENRCNFQFDFSKVYWNTRLGKEHERILDLLKPGDVLFDVFCGVGPFSIPAAKSKCKVFANDLNPDSFKWLNFNGKHNKVNTTFFKTYNQDGKDFIRSVFRDFIIDLCKGNQVLDESAKIHLTMNLPGMAVEFLKYFNGVVSDVSLIDKFNNEIIIYLYCFAVGDDPADVSKELVNHNMGFDISENILDVFNVRNVSPKKEMMRVTIKLTKDIIFGLKCTETNEPPQKKLCTGETQ